TARCFSAGRLKVVFSENPQLRDFDSTKCRHWVIAEWSARQRIFKLLARFGRRVRQNEMCVIAVQILVPRLIAVPGPDSIETFEVVGEIALEYRSNRG